MKSSTALPAILVLVVAYLLSPPFVALVAQKMRINSAALEWFYTPAFYLAEECPPYADLLEKGYVAFGFLPDAMSAP